MAWLTLAALALAGSALYSAPGYTEHLQREFAESRTTFLSQQATAREKWTALIEVLNTSSHTFERVGACARAGGTAEELRRWRDHGCDELERLKDAWPLWEVLKRMLDNHSFCNTFNCTVVLVFGAFGAGVGCVVATTILALYILQALTRRAYKLP